MDLEQNVWRGFDIDKRDPKQTHLTDSLGYMASYLFPIKKKEMLIQRW